MNNRGDLPTLIIGEGGESYPSLAFQQEPVTGIYLDQSGTSSSFTISKKGTKRLRIDDSETEIYGTLIANNIAPIGNVELEDGSASAPSLSFQSSLNTGLYHEGSGIAFSLGGVKKAKLDTPSGLSLSDGLSCGSISAGGFITAGTNSISSNSFRGTDNVLLDVHFADASAQEILRLNHTGSTMYSNLSLTSASSNSILCGPFTCSSFSNSGTFSNTASSTFGAMSVSSLLSSGTAQCTGFTCTSFSNSGTLSNTASSTFGAMSVSSLLSSGTAQCTGLTTASINNSGSMTSGPVTSSIFTSTAGGGAAGFKFSGFSGTHSAQFDMIMAGTSPQIETVIDSAVIVETTPTGVAFVQPISTSTVADPTNTSQLTFSNTAITSNVLITQPRTWVRACMTVDGGTGTNGTSAMSNNTNTFVTWSALESTLGSSSNFSTSLPGTTFTIPTGGTGGYVILYNIMFSGNTTGIRQAWIEINSAGAGTTRAYGKTAVAATSTGPTACSGCAYLSLSATNTIQLGIFQNSGGTLAVLGTSPNQSSVQIIRLF